MSPLLRIGSTGPNVMLVQILLNFAGAASPLLVVDGIFGPKTQAAVLKFQKTSRLAVDGIVGPMSMQALAGTAITILFAGKLPKAS